MAWRIKVNAKSQMCEAGKRRLNSWQKQEVTLSEEYEVRLNLSSPEERSSFGYNYLEWKSDV